MKPRSKAKGKMSRKELFQIAASAAIGIVSTEFCESYPHLLALWGLMPLLWLETESRKAAYFVLFVFYLAISRGIVPGAYVFFQDGSFIRALVLWVLSAAALAAPWGLFWSEKSPAKRACGAIFSILVSIPPPLGWIGWGNSLTGAGLFFPGFGWFGLILMLDLYAEAAQSVTLRRTLIVMALLAVPFLTLAAVPEKVTAGGVAIQGIDTAFGRMASGSGDFDTQYERERAVFQLMRETQRNGELEGADIVILPETIIGRANPATLKRWGKFFEPFTQKGTVFIAGGEIPTDRGRKYNNVMISFEEKGKNQTAVQRFPVPFSMWRPFAGEGANAYPFSSAGVSVMEVHGRRLGFLVCYEQFLTWPFLRLMLAKPDVIAAPSNLWWCRDTSLPGIQKAAVRLWAKLFGVPAAGCANR
jgi:apolipoprotein N-acyltransferase